MSCPLHHSVHKVGEINKNKRIWIANTRLTKSFEIGDPILIEYHPADQEVVVTRAELLSNHSISSRNGKTPILDIKNALLTEALDEVEKVEVLYYPEKIVIRATKKEKARLVRKGKDIRKTFELFCGGGTLTQMFKQNGFVPRGGLEFSEKFLTMFESNHDQDTMTILSAIEDIDPSDYPEDVGTVLCGIPCTTYSNGNLAMMQAQKRIAQGEGTPEDHERAETTHTAEALTHHVLNAIVAMNPKVVVVEEVVKYAEGSASMLLRTVLKQLGYHINEGISEGYSSKRKRWVLVAHMDARVPLENLDYRWEETTIEDHLEVPLDQREWQTDKENKRVAGMMRKASVGLRIAFPSEHKCNSFTTHGTRHTEPIIQLEGHNLYSEFTNEEIANIHGFKGYKLSGVKTLDRAVLGQGVTDMFSTVAHRVIETSSASSGENLVAR